MSFTTSSFLVVFGFSSSASSLVNSTQASAIEFEESTQEIISNISRGGIKTKVNEINDQFLITSSPIKDYVITESSIVEFEQETATLLTQSSAIEIEETNKKGVVLSQLSIIEIEEINEKNYANIEASIDKFEEWQSIEEQEFGKTSITKIKTSEDTQNTSETLNISEITPQKLDLIITSENIEESTQYKTSEEEKIEKTEIIVQESKEETIKQETSQPTTINFVEEAKQVSVREDDIAVEKSEEKTQITTPEKTEKEEENTLYELKSSILQDLETNIDEKLEKFATQVESIATFNPTNVEQFNSEKFYEVVLVGKKIIDEVESQKTLFYEKVQTTKIAEETKTNLINYLTKESNWVERKVFEIWQKVTHPYLNGWLNPIVKEIKDDSLKSIYDKTINFNSKVNKITKFNPDSVDMQQLFETITEGQKIIDEIETKKTSEFKPIKQLTINLWEEILGKPYLKNLWTSMWTEKKDNKDLVLLEFYTEDWLSTWRSNILSNLEENINEKLEKFTKQVESIATFNPTNAEKFDSEKFYEVMLLGKEIIDELEFQKTLFYEQIQTSKIAEEIKTNLIDYLTKESNWVERKVFEIWQKVTHPYLNGWLKPIVKEIKNDELKSIYEKTINFNSQIKTMTELNLVSLQQFRTTISSSQKIIKEMESKKTKELKPIQQLTIDLWEEVVDEPYLKSIWSWMWQWTWIVKNDTKNSLKNVHDKYISTMELVTEMKSFCTDDYSCKDMSNLYPLVERAKKIMYDLKNSLNSEVWGQLLRLKVDSETIKQIVGNKLNKIKNQSMKLWEKAISEGSLSGKIVAESFTHHVNHQNTYSISYRRKRRSEDSAKISTQRKRRIENFKKLKNKLSVKVIKKINKSIFWN